MQIGHRLSVDLDFFEKKELSASELVDLLYSFGKIQLLSQNKNIVVLQIDNIKVDFVNYRYPLIKEQINRENIRLYALPDIVAMKLAAIAGRGRKRDFIDIFFLFEHYSLSEMMSFYNHKFSDGSELMVARSLTYFEDAEQDEEPVLIKKAKWSEIKEKIKQEVRKEYI